jgi:tRNA(Ile)-lysidine synthase TilS/MesJ
MQCGMCREEAVTFQEYSGKYLCRRHFIEDIETKAKHTIRSRGRLRAGDHIGVVVSPDCAGMALLFFLHDLFSNRKDIRITAVIATDEGESWGRPETREKFAEELGITVVRGPVPVIAGKATGQMYTCPEAAIGEAGEAGRLSAFDTLGKKHGITKYAVPYCLDDDAVSLLTDMLRGEAGHIFVDPLAGNDGLPVIAPFVAIAADDIALYAAEMGIEPRNPSLPDLNKIGDVVRTMLDTYTGRHPSTKYSLMHLGESIRNAGAAAGVTAQVPGCCGTPPDNLCLRGSDSKRE